MSERVIYAKASVERRPEYRQQTLIIRDGDRLLARKTAVGEAAKNHIRQYRENYIRLTEALKEGHPVSFVPCTENPDGSMDFPYCTDPTFGDRLAEGTADDYIRKLGELREALVRSFGSAEFKAEDGFRQLYGDVHLPEGLEALGITNADMNFENIFCPTGDTYVIIDYEWIFDFPVPLTYLIYRSLLLDPTWNGYPEEDRDRILEALRIESDLRRRYDLMEAAFLNRISPEENKLDHFARAPGARQTTVQEIDALLRLPEEKRSLEDELNGYKASPLFRGFRKADAAAHRIRDRIRTVARRENAVGRACSFIVISRREGPAAARRKIRWVRTAKKKERQFLRQLDREAAQDAAGALPSAIKISVLVPLYNTPKDLLLEMIDSVRKQTYRNWELCLADGSDDGHAYVGEECRRLAGEDSRILYRKLEKNLGISENTNACIDMAGGEYYALFDHDDLLQPNALSENIRVITEQGADFIYSDEFVFASPDKTKLIATHFKQDYAPESLLSNNYICHLTVFKASLLEKAGRFRKEYDGSQDFDLILRLTDCAEKVAHIPKVLYFWRSHATSVASDISTKTYAIEAGRKAVTDFLRSRRQTDADVESAPEYPTMYHVRYPVRGEPAVSIVADFTGFSPEETANRIRGWCEGTEYRNVSVTAVTDTELPEGAFSLRVNRIPSGGGTRPQRLNDAIRRTDGEYIVVLDPGLECENWEWLSEMLMFAQQKQTGAVGAKISFGNGTIRHSGLIIGLGSKRLAGRSHFEAEPGNTGYFGHLCMAENVSAVSAECMMFRREVFEETGGFPEDYLDTLFDVEFCLKLLAAGYRNVYTPFAKLRGGKAAEFSLNYGTESDSYPHDARVFKNRCRAMAAAPDPYYNPNLTVDYPNYSIRI